MESPVRAAQLRQVYDGLVREYEVRSAEMWQIAGDPNSDADSFRLASAAVNDVMLRMSEIRNAMRGLGYVPGRENHTA